MDVLLVVDVLLAAVLLSVFILIVVVDMVLFEYDI